MAQQAIQGLQIVVRHPDGRTEQFAVDADSVLVGSGAYCEIRLPQEHAAVEHVSLRLVSGGVHAEARSLSPHPTINGVGFVQTPVQPDSVIGVGKIQLWVRSADLSEDNQQKVIRKKKNKTSPLTYVAAVLGLPLAGYLLMADPTTDATQTVQGTPPPLWNAPVAACPQAGRDQAAAIGSEKLRVALGKRERRPFHVEDGVAAVPLFETASICFRTALMGAESNEAARAAQSLRVKIDEDYRAHQVRLEHALTVKDWDTAQSEAAVLRAFTEGKQGTYVSWLSNLLRELETKQGRKEGSS